MNDKFGQAIVAALGPDRVQEEYARFGLTLIGGINDKGFVTCKAHGRPDNSPSAAINVNTGWYNDLGGTGEKASLFSMAETLNAFPTWKDAKKHYAELVGIPWPGKEEKNPKSPDKPKGNPDEHFQVRPWDEVAVAQWLAQVDQLLARNPLFCRSGARIFPLHLGFNF